MSKSHRPRQRLAIAAGLFALAVVIYGNTLFHGYVLDDALVITDNRFTQQGLSGWPEILTRDAFAGFFGEDKASSLVSGGRYRPLSQLMFALEWQFAGNNPMVGHALNILCYGLTAVLVFLLFERLLRRGRATRGLWGAAFGALIFVVHPLHTEVVANIKGRDEILAMMLMVGALLYLLRKDPTRRTLAVATGLTVLAVLAKESAVTLAVLAPLVRYLFCQDEASVALRLTAPIIVVCLIYAGLRGMLMGGDPGWLSTELMNNPFLVYEQGILVAMEAGTRYATVLNTLGDATALLLVPHPLTHDYYPRHVAVVDWGHSGAWLGLVAALLLVCLMIMTVWRRQRWGYAIWLFVLPLLLTSNLLFPIGAHFAERFMYLPSLGFCLAIAFATDRLSRVQWSGSHWIAPVGLSVVALTFSWLTIDRNRAWASNLTLFTTDLATSANSAKLRNALGGVLIEEAIKTGPTDVGLLQQAIVHLDRATEIHPLYRSPYLLKGNALLHLQQPAAALAQYEQVLRLDSGYPGGWLNRAIALTTLHRHDEALASLDTALDAGAEPTRVNTAKANLWRARGQFEGEQRGNVQAALAALQVANRLRPGDFETLRLWGIALGVAGDQLAARERFEQALAVASDDRQAAIALMNLGISWQGENPQRSRELFAQAEATLPGISADFVSPP